MLYDIVTSKELQDITKDEVLREANTECILRNKVQAVAQGLVESREGYGIEKIVELLERLSRDRKDGVVVEDGEDNKRVRAKYGTSDYVYYTVFMGMLQNHPLISRRLEEYAVIKQGQGDKSGNTIKVRQVAGLGVIKLESGRMLVFQGNSILGEVAEGESNSLKWFKTMNTKLIPKVAKLIKSLENAKADPIEDNSAEDIPDDYY